METSRVENVEMEGKVGGGYWGKEFRVDIVVGA